MAKVKQPKKASSVANAREPVPDFKKIYQLAEHYSEASSLLKQQASGKEWGCSAPQLVVDSFAVELYLKCLYVMDTNSVPLKGSDGHDWKKLFKSLLPNTRTAISEEFERIVNSDPFLPILRKLPDINPEAVRYIDFEYSLTAARNTFVKIRYLYEYEPQRNEKWFMLTLFEKRSALSRARILGSRD